MSDWNVVAKLRIMPEGVDVDLGKIQEKVKEVAGDKCEVHSIEEKPIAFGLVALEVNLLLNDRQGGMDEVQEKISAIEGVSEAEVVDLNRL
ncbi:MAG: elongation factor 1-beta [Candidatus Altiarchaeales archaeon]|nr:elongation factor 1-beta [Candidatus Altiarchaeales archaeon]MBD3415507.1 elongation factor 1-beta [Candidatus Altiarchaeales archaeon]